MVICSGRFAAIFFSERFNEINQHLALVFAAYRVESLARRSECITFLKGKAHFTGHVVWVLDEILVVVHGELFGLACARFFIFGRALTADAAHVNGLCRLLTIHSLADNDDVRRDGCTAKGLVIHAECSDEVRTSLVHNPVAQSLAVIERAV